MDKNNKDHSEKEDSKTLTNINIVLGSYEGKIFCLDFNLITSNLKTYSFKVSENCLKTIINSDKHIFASGNDEIIHIYDIENREEKGLVLTYNGSISKIIKFKDFLFAGGDSPSIGIWRMTDFANIASLKGHKNQVNDFILHNNGKVIISVSKDNFLIIWNTTNGKAILKYNLKKNCNKLLFGKKQNIAYLIFDNEVWMIKLNNKSNDFNEWIVKKKVFDKKIMDCIYVKENLIIFHQYGDVKVFTEFATNDNYIELKLEMPEAKENEEIRVKIINFLKYDKIKLLFVVFSTNDIILYDLVKNLKNLESIKIFEKFRLIKLLSNERITAITSFVK